MENKHEWISVEDSMPHADEEVVVCIQKRTRTYTYYRIGYFDSEENDWTVYCEIGELSFKESTAYNVDHFDITHWMRLHKP